MQHIFTWVPAYQGIVAKLKSMRGNQPELIRALTQIGIDVRQDESSPGTKIPSTEIEPFTFLCYLNIFGDIRRKKVLRNLCQLWNISGTIDDVCGIPSVSGQKIWLFPYKYDRNNDEITRLWDFFEALLANTITDEIFENVLQIENVGPKKLTEVMFLVKPDLYLCLNSAVEPYLQQVKKINTSFSSYSSLKLVLNQIKSTCAETFPQLSYDGYLYREYSNKPINYFRLGSTDGNGGASMLPDMLENSTVNIGWADIGDIDYIEPNTRPGINQKMLSLEYYKDKKNQKSLISRKAGEIFRFYSDLKPNDIVVVNDGYAVLAIGRILTNTYFFLPDLEFPHSRLVEWTNPQVKNLSITEGNQTSVWQLEDEGSINAIEDYLAKKIRGTKDKIETINKQNSKIMELNTILYGPPGTGKTHMLSEVIKDRKLIETPQTKEANYDEFVTDYHWWQIIAMALLNVEGSIKVPDLRNHPLIQAKYRNSTLKSLDARLWSTMQHNSSDECKNVKLKKKLGGVRIFFKETDSSWRLEDKEDFKETFPDLIEEYGALTNPGAIGKEIKHYTFATCHQSLAYEDFIEGIKPVISPNDEGIPSVNSILPMA